MHFCTGEEEPAGTSCSSLEQTAVQAQREVTGILRGGPAAKRLKTVRFSLPAGECPTAPGGPAHSVK